MRQFKLLLFVIFPILSVGCTAVQNQTTGEILPINFGEQAFRHIEVLSSFGHRQVGSANEAKTIQYIREQFETMKLEVEIQPFQFESFEYGETNLIIDGKSFDNQ